jgi:hypothetical protein
MGVGGGRAGDALTYRRPDVPSSGGYGTNVSQ